MSDEFVRDVLRDLPAGEFSYMRVTGEIGWGVGLFPYGAAQCLGTVAMCDDKNMAFAIAKLLNEARKPVLEIPDEHSRRVR